MILTDHKKARTAQYADCCRYACPSSSLPVIALLKTCILTEELAALRARGGVKDRAANLQGGALSTPEAEAAALKAKKDAAKAGKQKATEILNKGGQGGGMSQELEYSLSQKEKRKQEQKQKDEAKQLLNKGGTVLVDTQQVIGKSNNKRDNSKPVATKSAPQEAGKGGEKAETVKSPAAKVQVQSSEVKESRPAPAGKSEPATSAAVKEEDDGDVPELEEPAGKSEPVTPATVEKNGDEAVPELEDTDGVPELEVAGAEPTSTDAETAQRSVTNRNEKKARKMLQRLGMRQVSGIDRVTLKMGDGKGYFFIDKPDVYTASGTGKSDTYIFFGEARQGANPQQQMAMAQQAAAQQAAMAGGAAGLPKKVKEQPPGMETVFEKDDVPNLAEVTNPEEPAIDEDGVDAKDIDLVMSQAGCSRQKAVAALKDNDGDLVNAIMAITT